MTNDLTPEKVIIIITADEYIVQVKNGDKLISHRRSIMESAGSAACTKKGDIFDDISNEFEELAESIDSLDLPLFSVAGELYRIKEDGE